MRQGDCNIFSDAGVCCVSILCPELLSQLMHELLQDLQRLAMLPFHLERDGEISTGFNPLVCTARPEAECLGQRGPHRPRELLSARLTRRPRLYSLCSLRARHLHEAADVRRPTVPATRASQLDRRRVRVEADEARSHDVFSLLA